MSDKDYLGLCKDLIAERYLLGTPDGHWRQRDFEVLSRIIEDKSGIRLSLSTLKRIWRSDFAKTPHPSTLDALASLVDCQDWLSFKRNYQQSTEDDSGPSVKNSVLVWVLVSVALILVGFLVIVPEISNSSSYSNTSPMASGPIQFTANKTIATGVPNTVVFKYDLSNLHANSFYLQQSWNEKHRVSIDPLAGNYSSTYYTPGFHRAKLLANDSIFKTARIHIKTDGWLPLVRYSRDDLVPTYIRDQSVVTGGQLSATLEQLQAAGVDVGKNFTLSYHNTREFKGVESSNFQLKTTLKADSLGNYACPQISVTIVCEEGIFYVPLTTLGCVGNLEIKLGETVSNGNNSDLSAFGANIYQWQKLHISVTNKKAKVFLNDQQIFQGKFETDYGLIMGLVINFTGTGSVDHAEMRDVDGNLVYQDSFL